MSDSDFDLVNINSSSEEQIPQKRQRPTESLPCSLPDPLSLLEDFKSLSKHSKKTPASKAPVKPLPKPSAIISKPATLNSSEKDDLEQYDYFASQSTAILTNWKSAQELPDPNQVPDRSKFIKSLRPKHKLDLVTKIEREIQHIERAKKGKRQFQKDQERKMRQQYDS